MMTEKPLEQQLLLKSDRAVVRATNCVWRCAICVILATVVLSIFCASSAYRKYRAAQTIQSHGGKVKFLRPAPSWIFKRISYDSFNKGILRYLGKPLHADFGTNTNVSNSSLRLLQDLPGLSFLCLYDAGLQDDDLSIIASLESLQFVVLSKNQISDKGLIHLRGLSQLAYLDLTDTNVTDRGVEQLQRFLPECQIVTSHSKITQ